jgi:hypothetical protein
MSILTLPTPPKRPEFGPWADKPRSEWTPEQAQEWDEKIAVYKQECEATVAGLEGLPDYLNLLAAPAQGRSLS